MPRFALTVPFAVVGLLTTLACSGLGAGSDSRQPSAPVPLGVLAFATTSGVGGGTTPGGTPGVAAVPWPDTSPDTDFSGWKMTWPGGSQGVTEALDVQPLTWGCDGHTEPMRPLSGSSPVPTGLLWVSPPDVETTVTAFDSEAEEGGDTRKWNANLVYSEVTITTATTGTWTVRWPGGRHSEPIELRPMDGAENMLSLSDGGGVAVPVAELLVTTQDTQVLVVRRYSYEGVTYQPYRLGSDLEPVLGGYLYLCAF